MLHKGTILKRCEWGVRKPQGMVQCAKAGNGEGSGYLNPERELCEEGCLSHRWDAASPQGPWKSGLRPHSTHSEQTQQEAKAKVAF